MDLNAIAHNNQNTTDSNNPDLEKNERSESVDTIRQILFGEDRRVLDAKIQNLTLVIERLTKSHQEDLASLESRLRNTHAEENSNLKRLLADANTSQKNATEALAINIANAAKSSNEAFDKKLDVLQVGLQTQSETSANRARDLAQTQTTALAQLKTENKALHDNAGKTLEEKLNSVDKTINLISQNLNNYLSTKQFSEALRSLAKQFDVPNSSGSASGSASASSMPTASNATQHLKR